MVVDGITTNDASVLMVESGETTVSAVWVFFFLLKQSSTKTISMTFSIMRWLNVW